MIPWDTPGTRDHGGERYTNRERSWITFTEVIPTELERNYRRRACWLVTAHRLRGEVVESHSSNLELDEKDWKQLIEAGGTENAGYDRCRVAFSYADHLPLSAFKAQPSINVSIVLRAPRYPTMPIMVGIPPHAGYQLRRRNGNEQHAARGTFGGGN